MINYLLLLFSATAYAHTGCPSFEIPVPNAQRVALAPVAGASLPEEPEIIHLSYRFELCNGGTSEIYLVESHANGEFKSESHAFTGKIDKFYVPRNAVEEFAPLGAFAKLVRSDYRMITAPNASVSSAELRIYSEGRLYSLSARREPDGANKFAPFEVLKVSARVPANAGVQLVWYPRTFRAGDLEFALWTLESSDGYQMTYLIDIQYERDLKLIADFVVDADGKFLLDPPKVEGRALKFLNIGKWVRADQVHVEMGFAPMTKVLWQSHLLKNRPTHTRSLSATFSTPADSPEADEERQLWAGPIDRDVQLHEWLEMLSSSDLSGFVVNRAQLRAQGLEALKFLLLDEAPAVSRLKDEVSVGAVESICESATNLMIAGALDLEHLRKIVRGHLVKSGIASEPRCQRALSHAMRANGHDDLSLVESQNLRKLSFNLDVLKRRLVRAQ